MQLIFVFLLFLSSCSRDLLFSDESNSKKVNNYFSDAKYIVLQDNPNTPYASKQVRIAEIEGNTFYYTVGLLNDYSIEPDGTPRPGNHPDREFRIQNAAYRIIREGSVYRFKFMQSSCRNPATNPFSSIITTSLIIATQSSDKLIIEVTPGDSDTLYREEATVSQLWSQGNVKRILCDGETND